MLGPKGDGSLTSPTGARAQRCYTTQRTLRGVVPIKMPRQAASATKRTAKCRRPNYLHLSVMTRAARSVDPCASVDGKPSGVDRKVAKHPTMPNEGVSPQQGADYDTLFGMHCRELAVTPHREHRAAQIVLLRAAGQITAPKQARYRGVVKAPSRGPPKADGPRISVRGAWHD